MKTKNVVFGIIILIALVAGYFYSQDPGSLRNIFGDDGRILIPKEECSTYDGCLAKLSEFYTPTQVKEQDLRCDGTGQCSIKGEESVEQTK